MTRPIIIGLTGQTGAGKTTVANIMLKHGCSVIDSDIIARDVVNYNNECISELKNEFGRDILSIDGNINRTLLAKRAFQSKEKTQRLNDITHPYILNNIKEKIDELIANGSYIIVIDAALLFESNANSLCDKVITVIAPRDIRLKRIIKRDNISLDLAALRVNAQNNQDFYVRYSDYIINGADTIDIISNKIKCFIYNLKE